MSVIPERKDFKKVSPDVAVAYPSKLVECGYELVSTVKSTEKSHFDRYGLVKGGKRVVVVYDVKAQMLSVTAFDEFIGEVCSVLDAVRGGINLAKTIQKKPNENAGGNIAQDQKIGAKQKSVPTNINNKKKDDKKAPKSQPQAKQNKETPKVQPQEKQAKESPKAQPQVKQTKETPKAQPQTKQAKEFHKPQANQPVNAKQKHDDHKGKAVALNDAPAKIDSVSAKGDFTLKKYPKERFDGVLEGLKQKKIKAKQKQAKGTNNGEQVLKYELSDGNAKLTVCFTADKGILQIQGKPGEFMSRVQTVFSESGDFKTAVNAHIEQKKSPGKASDVERRLKKYLPTGVLYLSSQAKIDFSIGIIDLLSSDTVLSDYSSLLIPPYRGLEMLIFDLQKAQGIKVKMIGQAFEKTANGEYTLKASYRKRIGSVIFNEVMTALYSEYNSTRNFYVHSALGSGTKVISDKNQAKAIYEKMLAVVEYNAKKLKEINFSI